MPIAGANVRLADRAISSGTRKSGEVTFSDVPAAQYELVVRAIGYEPARATIPVPASDGVEVVVTLAYAVVRFDDTPSEPAMTIFALPRDRPVLSLDSLNTADLADIEIIKGNGSGDPVGKKRRLALMDTLVMQQHRWESVRPATYRIRVVEISDCIVVAPRESGRLWPRVVVRDTFIVGSEQEPRPPAYANRCVRTWRVEDLFRDLAQAIADTKEYIHDGISYDPVYGFPRSYWTSPRYGRGWGRFVESFVPLQSAP